MKLEFTPCPLCSETTFKKLYDSNNGKGNNVAIVRCKNCHLVYCYPMPVFDESDFRDQYTCDYYFFSDEAKKRWARINLNEFQSRLSNRKRCRVLDIGFGEGYFLKLCRDAGYEVLGVEVSDEACKAIEGHGINVFHGQLADARLESNHFDIVFLNNVLEHVPHPVPLLKEISRIMASGGLFGIYVPNADSSYYKLVRLLTPILSLAKISVPRVINPWEINHHVVGWSPDTITMAIWNVQLEIVDMRVYSSFYEDVENSEITLSRRAKRRGKKLLHRLSNRLGSGTIINMIARKGVNT